MTAVHHRTKKDYALTLIRDLIMNGELDPGAQIHQTDLAARLQISLTPVREALRQLEAEGLVAAVAHRGVRVRSIDTSTLRNVYFARRLLEPYLAARGVARLQPADIRSAEDLLQTLDHAHGNQDPIGVRHANYEFHFLLYQQADVPLMEEMVRKLWAQYPWDVLSVVPSRMDASKQEHEEILAAMAESDAGRVARACAKHLLQSYLDIVCYLDPEQSLSDPFSIQGLTSSVDIAI